MSKRHTQDESERLAALFVAGAMPPDEAEAFEAHLPGCASCRSEVRALGAVSERLLDEIPPLPMPAARRRDLLARVEGDARADDPQVWKRWSQPDQADDDLIVHRNEQAVWQEIGIPGIRVQRLFVDPARDQITMRVQMDPGTAYPPHVHGGPEECFVLKGELIVDEMVLRAGDYQRAGHGSRHPVQRTETGCELLIVSSLSDELE